MMLSSDVNDMKPIFIKYSKNQLLDIYNSDLSHCTPHCFLPQNYIGDIPLRSDKYDSLKPNYKKKSFELDYESHAYPPTSSRKLNGRHARAEESAIYDRFSRGTGIGDRGRKYIIQNNLATQTKYYQSSSLQNKFANTNKITNRPSYDKETPFDEVPYGRKQFSQADSHFLDGLTQDDLTTTRDYDKDNHGKSNSNPFLRQHNSGSPPSDMLEHAKAYDRNSNKFYDETKSYEPKGISMFDRRRYGPHISQNASSYQRNNMDYKKRNTTTAHYNSNYHFNNAQHNNSKYGISPATVEEPEWFTEGPTSHMDKIELGGFFNQQKDHPSNDTISNNNSNENILCETNNELLASEHYGSDDINGNHNTAKNVDTTNIMFDYQAWKKSMTNVNNANTTNRNIGNLSDYSKLDNISEEQTVCDDMTTNKERIIYKNEGTDAFGTHNINKKEPATAPNTSPRINQYDNDVDIPLPNISGSTQIMNEDENTLFQSRFKAFFDEKSIRNYTNVNALNKCQDQTTLQGKSLDISENDTNDKQMTPFQKLAFAIQTHQKQFGEKNVVTSPEPISAFQKSMNLSHLSQIPLPSGDPTIKNNYPDNFESEIVDENLTEADILRGLNFSPNQKNVENIDYDTLNHNNDDNANANITDNSQLLLSMLQKLNITSTHASPYPATNKPNEDTFSGTLDSNDHDNNINNPNPNNTNRMAMKNVINHFYSTANTFQHDISSTQSHNNNLPYSQHQVLFGKISAPTSNNNTTTIITNHTAMANNNIIPPPLPPQFVMGYPPPPFGLVPPLPPIPPFFPPPSLLSRSAVLPPPPHLPMMMPPPPPPDFMMATLSGGGFPQLSLQTQAQQAMTDQQQQTRQTTMDGNQINQSMKENTSNKNMFLNPTTNNMRNILPENPGNKSLRSVTNLTPTAVFRHLMSNSPKNVDLQPDYTTREAVSNNFKHSSNNMDGNTIMQYLSLLREQKNIINNFTTQQDNSKAFESTTHNSKGMDSLIDKINLNVNKNIKQSDFDENNNFMNTGFSLTLLQQQYVSLVNLLKMRDKLTPAQIALLQNYFSQFQSAINKAGLQHLFALEPNTSHQQSTDNFSNCNNNEIKESLELRNNEID